MTCFWCGKPISLFRAWIDSDYCSAEHRAADQAHLQRLGMKRLLQAANRDSIKLVVARSEESEQQPCAGQETRHNELAPTEL